MSEGEQREEAVFEAALQLPAEQRPAYLDQACAGEADLRRRVEGLLAAFERAGAFMKQPAAAERTGRLSLPPTVQSGDLVGDYKLLQQIGEGGCGVVYMADQTQPVRRRVALKILKPGLDTKQVIARFEAERQALALMDHPHIAKVFDAGATESGRPFFVMELVRGVKLTEFCDENELPMKQRLELFIQVCQAIQHAHQKGIIHRDIKPSNILVTVNDGVPVPKVIDFGIAKATTGQPLTDKTLFTAFEQFIGTPAYMSPEQAEMTSVDIDTRSDIYSLGVLLYELLTGRTPFDTKELLRAGFDEMRRTILEKEPMRPSMRLSTMVEGELTTTAQRRHTDAPKLIHLVRGDLDWIVVKALEKDRARRYETANGLAADLTRHLNDHPVVARPPSRLYEFQKTVRRHKFGFAAGAAVIMALAVGVIVSIWQAVRATRAEALANLSAVQLKQTDRARTEELYHSYLDQIHAKRLSDQAGHRSAGLDLVAKAVAIRPSLELISEATATLATIDVRPGRTWNLTNIDDWIPYYFDGKLERYALPAISGGIHIRRVSDDVDVARLHEPNRTIRLIFGFSPDGRYLAAAYREQKHWSVWDVASERIILENPEWRNGIVFSRDGERMAASHPDGRIVLYQLPSGKEVASVQAGRSFSWLSLNASGNRVLGCEEGVNEVGVWTFTTGETLSLTSPDSLVNADWGGDDLIAACSETGRIHVWNAHSGQLHQTIRAHDAHVQQVLFNHRGDLLASTSWDGTTRFCNPWTGQVYLNFPCNSQALQFSLDDTRFSLAKLALGPKSQFAFLEVEESPVARRIEHFGHLGNAWSLSFSPDARWLAVADALDGGVRLYDVASGRLLADLAEFKGRMVIFEPGGKRLLTGGPEGLNRWELIEAKEGPVNKVRFGPRQPISPLKGILYGALTSDGRWLACTQERSTNQVWLVDLADPENPAALGQHHSVLHVSISPDGRWVASGSWQSMEGVKVWNTRNRTLEKTLPMRGSMMAWSSDGRWLVTSGTQTNWVNTQQVWDTQSWKLRHSLELQHSHGFMAFSPDSRVVACVTDQRLIRLHEVESFRELATLESPNRGSIVWLQFSSDGQHIAALEVNHGIQLWDLAQLRKELKARGLDWEGPPHLER